MLDDTMTGRESAKKQPHTSMTDCSCEIKQAGDILLMEAKQSCREQNEPAMEWARNRIETGLLEGWGKLEKLRRKIPKAAKPEEVEQLERGCDLPT